MGNMGSGVVMNCIIETRIQRIKGSDRHCMVVELGLQYLFSGFGESRDFKGV